jgi:hypothetical protein
MKRHSIYQPDPQLMKDLNDLQIQYAITSIAVKKVQMDIRATQAYQKLLVLEQKQQQLQQQIELTELRIDKEID